MADSALDRTVPGRPIGGRRTPIATTRGTLRITDFVDVTAVTHSPACDWTTGVDFGLYQNDQFGVCGPTFVANSRRLATKWCTGVEKRPAQADVFDLYRRSGNPGFDPATGADDNGVEMRTMLDAVIKGGIGGTKALAYAAIDPHDWDQVKAAIEIFHGIGHGLTLDDAQKAQTDSGTWEYVSGSPVWGGHAVLGAGFDHNDVQVITWALKVNASQRFIQRQDDEAWIVIWPEHLADPRVDVARLSSAYTALTGRPFPSPPAPADPDRALAGALRSSGWLDRKHVGAGGQVAAAASAWLKAKGL